MMKKFLLLLLIPFLACSQPNETKLDTDQLVEDLRFISSDQTEGRRTGTEGNRIAREYLITRFQEVGTQPFQDSYTHDFSFTINGGEEMTGINVITQIEGKSDSMIVISAHYDHLGKRDSLIFNGADDNASGTAALLAISKYFIKEEPNHTLVFAAFDAEEMGLQGARALVEDSVFLNKVKLNINMDMISKNDNSEIYAAGTYHYPFTKPVLESINTVGLKLLFGHDTPDPDYKDWTFFSDQGPFHSKGIPFTYFGVEDHENSHRHTDDFDTIPLDFYKRSVQLILNAIIAFDQQ